MGYRVVAIQNSSGFAGNSSPTVCVKMGDPDWESAFKSWLSGANPTSSPEWKKGVVAITERIVDGKDDESGL